MIILSIDGAARRPGKPDCISAGVVFVKTPEGVTWHGVHEYESTSQRGEISAIEFLGRLVLDINSVDTHANEFHVITDSEYVFNTVSKDWVGNWANKGWLSSLGEPVKNRDLWETFLTSFTEMKGRGVELIPFCIKGHLFSIGKKTVEKIMAADASGEFLYKTVHQIVVDKWDEKEIELDQAIDQFERVNGYRPPIEAFVTLVVCNTVSDALAGYYADQVNAAWLG